MKIPAHWKRPEGTAAERAVKAHLSVGARVRIVRPGIKEKWPNAVIVKVMSDVYPVYYRIRFDNGTEGMVLEHLLEFLE